ncbi:alpha/beta fold hydrolase [Catellatospora tritici]|uniref:alpha/beta fold hydrolase n=1 Tax=Catellatospora tritici TaxID=2851566 RepID=UPI001C2DCAC7|nr:alpha/beta hydrolase [Catellatospora tritici]MBV1854814.1 alpha/beta hydrolase [Catellatospora tritici]
MDTFASFDDLRLAYHVSGDGEPLVCVPGGPMQASAYLGDLGGLDAHRRLVRLDLRGTGGSAVPDYPATYRFDRQVGDVEALREELGLARFDLLGHSAGGSLALAYALAHPGRIRHLVLVTPSLRPIGAQPDPAESLRIARQRRDEPWFDEAYAALERVNAGTAADDDWAALAPFSHGRWDEAARAYDEAGEALRNRDAARQFYADGALDPATVLAGVVAFGAPVLVVAGGVDLWPSARLCAEFAAMFPSARLVTQPGAGHAPWRDDPAAFVSAVTSFLES